MKGSEQMSKEELYEFKVLYAKRILDTLFLRGHEATLDWVYENIRGDIDLMDENEFIGLVQSNCPEMIIA